MSAGSVAVVIPVRNDVRAIAPLVQAVRTQRLARAVEVIVVDDGSSDGTADAAERAGARVLRRDARDGGNPAAARNLGARAAQAELLVFLDADCVPADGWLAALVAPFEAGASMVGGALALPAGLSLTARCDYYAAWYHVHERRPAAVVPNHPPGNFAVRRALFLDAGGFTETQPLAYAHEELHLQARLRAAGHRIRFEPRAIVYHHNRPGVGNLLRRSYRWAYSAIEGKAESGAARVAWLWRRPALVAAAALPLALAQGAYVVGSWARAGVWEPLRLAPLLLLAQLAYGAGLAAGGVRWMRHRGSAAAQVRPRWE